VQITSSPFRELPKLEFDEYRDDELGVGAAGDLLGPCWLEPTDSWLLAGRREFLGVC